MSLFFWDTIKMLYIQNWWTIPLMDYWIQRNYCLFKGRVIVNTYFSLSIQRMMSTETLCSRLQLISAWLVLKKNLKNIYTVHIYLIFIYICIWNMIYVIVYTMCCTHYTIVFVYSNLWLVEIVSIFVDRCKLLVNFFQCDSFHSEHCFHDGLNNLFDLKR